MDGLNSYENFVHLHKNQLESSAVPQHLWKALHHKLDHAMLDAGNYFSITQVEYDDTDDENESDEETHTTVSSGRPCANAVGERVKIKKDIDIGNVWKVIVSTEEGVNPEDPNQIFLIDHAWTYSVNVARQNLLQIPGLLSRMANLMEISCENRPVDNIVEDVMQEMWRYNQTYSLGGFVMEAEECLPIWYIMDEFGSRIQHSDDPSFRTIPFYFLPQQITYTLLFPLRKLEYGEEVTRNYVENPTNDPLTLQALKLPWVPCDMTFVDCAQEEPDEEFLRSGRIEESVPDLSIEFPTLCRERKIKVYSDYKAIRDYLKHPAFEITAQESDADIFWYNYHFKDFRDLSISCTNKLVNQFPFEHIVTVKDLLAIICRRAHADKPSVDPETLDTFPKWLPTTYNLKTELPKFVSYYQQREKRDLDNYWICKPWNLARGLDTHITNNLNYILRLPSTGPKVACKYVTDPVLFPCEDIGLVKLDIRYILLLRSIEPLTLYAYKRFWLRFANKPFSLDGFDDYEKHFTVMNYAPAPLRQMYCHDFIEKFEEFYSQYKWDDVEKEIFAVFKEVFRAATIKKPPSGICHSPQSRAMYAADVMLQWDRTDSCMPQIQPLILEINWAPDCQRACQYYPEFFDDVFSVLFLDKTDGRHVALL